MGKTWAIKGKTPIIRHCFNWPKLSVISAVSTNPHIYARQHPNKTIKTAQVLQFLQHLLKHGPKKMFIIWDRLQAHRAISVRNFMKKNSERLRMFFLPPYAPELNADEGVWNYIKWHKLKNYCPKNIKELQICVRKSIATIRKNPELIKSFFKKTPLNFYPFVN